MRRIGINPARERMTTYVPERVTVAVLSYIPVMQGYFADRLDILKMCLDSILTNTQHAFDLLVFDNGSCAKVREYLRARHDTGDIQYLFLSGENIGKIGAFKFIFNAAPGELVAYCDDDVFHYPGWLSEHVRILDHFPGVGMVSGVPIRDRFTHAMQSNIKFAESDAVVAEYVREIPDEWEIDFCNTTGRDVQRYFAETAAVKELKLTYQGVSAYGTANHFQFVAPKAVISALLPVDWSGRLMRHMAELDQAVDAAGKLRLCTLDRTARHMGNALVGSEGTQLLQSATRRTRYPRSRASVLARRIILRIPGVRSLLERIYHQLFLTLNVGKMEWFKQSKKD